MSHISDLSPLFVSAKTITTRNLMHRATMLRRAGGYPSEGKGRNAWKAGARFGFEVPEYRL